MNSSKGLNVIVWTPEGECENGVLRIGLEEISIRLETGRILTNKTTSNLFYKLRNDSSDTNNRIFFDPILFVTRPYAKDVGQIEEDVFPPSTGGFYGRLESGKENAVYIVQDIEKDTRKWLIIGDSKTGQIFEHHLIHEYESEAIKMIDGGEHQKRWASSISRDDAEKGKSDVLSVLDESSPSWEDISKLLSDVTIPNLELGESVRDTFSQFVPQSFPEPIREELMSFLAFVNKPEILLEDPVNFHFRSDSIQSFRYLMRGHLRCILSEAKWPPYIKYLKLVERRQLTQPIIPLDAQSKSPWDIFRTKVNESFPNWIGLAINSANELSKSNKVTTRIPATFSRAKRSKKIWNDRLAAVSYGLRIRGHTNHNMIGLTNLVYLGAAYRWPHRHMRFITKLGATSDNPPHIHVMTMPQNAAERVKRFLPHITEVAWSTRAVNYDLFDHDSGRWLVPVNQITKSINAECSMRKLVKQHSRKPKAETHKMSLEEAIVAGLVSRGIYLIDFEREGQFSYWGLNRKQIHSILTDLYKQGVVDLSYDVDVGAQLVSIASIAQGPPENLTSLIDSFLKYTPTSLAMVNNEADLGIVLSTLTEEAAYELVTKLPKIGIQSGLAIRCMRPTSFRSFTSDLYHRLLRDDGTWDDDVSAFLSQARSKRKELSESNA